MSETRRILTTWLGLLLLLAATAAISRLPLGMGNTLISLVIAAAKTSLIALVFMRLRADSALVRLAAGAAILWIGILYGLTLVDYASR
jgi:cytochrome c oxidase subunit 4